MTKVIITNNTRTPVAKRKVGTVMADGSVFAGITKDGQNIYAMPQDMSTLQSFNTVAKAVKNLNKTSPHDHNDWQVPTPEVMKLLFKNRNKGVLRDSFNYDVPWGKRSKHYCCPDYYMTNKTDHWAYDNSDTVTVVCFTSGNDRKDWPFHIDYKYACRLVRLEKNPAPPLRRRTQSL